MLGTLINAATVLIACLIGIALRKVISKQLGEMLFQATGLLILAFGITLVIKSEHFFFMTISVIIGVIIGELLHIHQGIERLSEWMKKRTKSKEKHFTEGFITGILLYCIGTLVIIGPLQEGAGKGMEILLVKSAMDAPSALVIGSQLGIGLGFSAVAILVVQGAITLLAGVLQPVLTDIVIQEISAVGGLIVMGIGLHLLKIIKIRLINFVPSLVVMGILIHFFV